LATKAYILMESAAGKTRDVVAALKALEGLKAADAVTGLYDVIVVLEAEDISAIGHLVDANIRGIPGVTRTVTCLGI
jgi:DNA-binding Lrp family transcriptional regulator